ncbi:MAG: cell division protein FtsZ [Treponema sp.]|nr:cell division protein FtsZ [Treponema sp.]
MNVLAVCEHTTTTESEVSRPKPQVLQFKSQEMICPSSLKVITTNENSQKRQRKDVPAVIKVISAGGGGGNALNRMIEADIQGVEFIAVNTDIQDLHNKSRAEIKVQIGAEVTGGMGAGGKPEKGERAALEDQVAIADALKGADMVFITAGMGGGTGTGSAPVIAKIARNLGALTVAVVTTPFEFEGLYKMRIAKEGIEKLREEVDTLIVIPNEHLFKIVDHTFTAFMAYKIADEVLCQGVQGISELITETGFQNTDFADVETIMKGKGDALMGVGYGIGENRALDAVKKAIDNPLLEDTSIEGATGILINISGPEDITMVEIQSIVKSIKEKCDPEAHIIQGLHLSNEIDNRVQITLIATGFKQNKYLNTSQTTTIKNTESDYIDFNEYVKMVERTKRPEFHPYIPQREYEDTLDVPSVIRNHNYHMEEKPVLNVTEKF